MIAARQIAFGGSNHDDDRHLGICFTAEGGNSTISMEVYNPYNRDKPIPEVTLETSVDDGYTWQPFYVGESVITLLNIGDKVYFRAGEGGNTRFASPDGYGSELLNRFVIDGTMSVSGNIMGLLSADDSDDVQVSSYCFCSLFRGCSSLLDAGELRLPAKTLADSCYSSMFVKCSSLKTAPKLLPATVLSPFCYGFMFNYCTSLTTAPEIHATTLAEYCCTSMFESCRSLTIAPALSATVLANYCYGMMFGGCLLLESAPELPATTLVDNCYVNMFINCTNLKMIKTNQESFAGCSSWLSGTSTSESATFICPATLGTNDTIARGPSACPVGWTVINED